MAALSNSPDLIAFLQALPEAGGASSLRSALSPVAASADRDLGDPQWLPQCHRSGAFCQAVSPGVRRGSCGVMIVLRAPCSVLSRDPFFEADSELTFSGDPNYYV